MTTKQTYLLAILLTGCVQFLQAQDLKLWYNKPAEKWTDALPLGNGRIGAMVFGGVNEDRIQLNEETLWTGGPRDYNKPGSWHYLDTIRQLLFAGKQREAEAIAGEHFMGLKSEGGKKEAWLQKIKSGKGLTGNPAAEKYNDSKWALLQVPAYDGWESVGQEGLDGAIWLRTYFTLPADWQGKDLVLDLNRIRDEDETYVNGVLIGSQKNTEARRYVIPAKVLHAGKNTIAIQVLNFFDKGGVVGYKDTAKHIGVYPKGNEQAKLSLNGKWKFFIQDDEPPAAGTYQASYQPFSDIWLRFSTTNITNYRRELDINTAIATTGYTDGEVQYKREYLVSQPQQVFVVQLTASKTGHINFEVALTSVHKKYTLKQIDPFTQELNLQVKHGSLKGVSHIRVRTKNGSIRFTSAGITVNKADEATVYITAATNYKNYKDVSANAAAISKKQLQSAVALSYAQIKQAHIKEYQQYFNTFSINFGKGDEQLPTDERLQKFATANDPAFAALYAQYGRYLLIAASRPGTRPANLQGIWNDLQTPPWGSKYTTNINLEMNYWPAELLNLSPLHEPLFSMIKELSVTGAATAKAYYNAPGWVLHHNTDLWRGTAAINHPNHGIWVTGGAWLCQHLWERYLFTKDKNFLQTQAYPLMKQAALFFNSFLIIDPVTGYLISTPSNSPEQGGLVAGPTMDHQIIRGLFDNVIQAAAILNTDEALRTELAEKYKRIAPNTIGKYGQLQEWMKDVDDTTNKHRHVSHLWGVYPGNEINWDHTPDMMKAARQSLLYRGDEATGWSLGWKINLWARFKDGDHTYRLIKMLLSPAKGGAGSYVNLFDAHPPFQIDGNFGGAAGIAEMLLQSHAGYLDILPALPAAIPQGSVKGLCARGGFEVSMQWNNGQLQQLQVLSKSGEPLILKYGNKETKLNTLKNKTYTFNAALQVQ